MTFKVPVAGPFPPSTTGFLFLHFRFGLTSPVDLAGLPTFNILSGGVESSVFFICLQPPSTGCTARQILSGQVKTVSVETMAATPIPTTLPLLATALGGLGFAGWRRAGWRRQQKAA